MILVGLSADVPSRHGLPEEIILKAQSAFEKDQITIRQSSSIWLHAKKENKSGDYFSASAVLSIDTHLYPLPLLALLQDMEAAFGRIHGFKNDPKALELYLLSYRREVFKNDYLTLPYPLLHEQTEFLLPIREIHKDWVHPYFDQELTQLLGKRENKKEFIALQDYQKLQTVMS